MVKWIYYVSYIYFGKTHDFSILKSEFPSYINWFKKFIIRIDSGFQGFASLYEYAELYIPYKKKRAKKGEKSELTEEQKLWNKEISKVRIFVEHSIGGMKRYNIIGYKNRLKDYNKKNDVLGVCAALWNFKLKLKKCC